MVDQQKIEKAVTLLLEAIGDDPKREGLIERVDRILVTPDGKQLLREQY